MYEEEEYNPDNDITLYTTRELGAMLRRHQEARGEIERTSLLIIYPRFSEDDIQTELETRAACNV